MNGFRGQRKEIPEHVGIGEICRRMLFLGMDEVRELEGIQYEENRRVVSYQIVVPVFRVELDRETPRVPCGISRALFSADSRKPDKNFSFLSNFREEFGMG